MIEQRLAVTAEVDVRETQFMSPEQAARHCLGIVRAKAEEEVEQIKGATLRTDKRPHIEIKRGEQILTGVACWLIYTNWFVWVPSSGQPDVVHAP